MADVLGVLQEDHRRIDELLGQLARSEPGTLRLTLLDELARTIEVHVGFEESEIDPMLAVIDADLAAASTAEHLRVRRAVDELRRLVDDDGYTAAADRLRSELSEHAADEEFAVFPRLRLETDTVVLDVLGEHLLDAHRTATRRDLLASE